MRVKYLLVILLLAVLVLLTRSPSLFGCFGGSQAQDPAAAPDFSVTRYTDDSKLSLSDLRGSVVLLYFWFPT
jgi:cytochrome oxidase Cu insertion factor (SCO1/SenC/PrrC family)